MRVIGPLFDNPFSLFLFDSMQQNRRVMILEMNTIKGPSSSILAP